MPSESVKPTYLRADLALARRRFFATTTMSDEYPRYYDDAALVRASGVLGMEF